MCYGCKGEYVVDNYINYSDNGDKKSCYNYSNVYAVNKR